MKNSSALLAALLGAGFVSATFAAEPLGYKDTPMLPGTPWHVHDPDRPRPHVVTPGATFSHNAPPPSDAVVLFDGKDLSKWTSDKGDAKWKVENGYMEAVKGAGNIRTKEDFSDFQLHVEFAEPAKVVGNSQGRGNSGVFLHGVYEVQVLDCYNNLTYPDGQTGGIYGQSPPLANACKKPGEWQTYDIIFEGPRWDENKKMTRPGTVTLIHNGVVLHNKKEILGETQHKELAHYTPGRTRGPIGLQDHGNPIRYRNIWIRNLGEYDKP